MRTVKSLVEIEVHSYGDFGNFFYLKSTITKNKGNSYFKTTEVSQYWQFLTPDIFTPSKSEIDKKQTKRSKNK